MKDEVLSSEQLTESINQLGLAARRVAAYGLCSLTEGYRIQIQQAVDADLAAITVQIDIPSMSVRVMVDGQQWIAPQAIFAADPFPPGYEHPIVPGHERK